MATARQQIREAIKYQLLQITESAGYYSTIREVNDPPRNPTTMNRFASVNLTIGREDCANENAGSHLQRGQNLFRLHNSFVAEMDCYLFDVNNPVQAQEYILADVKKHFSLNYYIPDEASGARTAFNSIYSASLPWGLTIDKPNCGITIWLRVWYREEATDPDTLA